MVMSLQPLAEHRRPSLTKAEAPAATFTDLPADNVEEMHIVHVRWFDHYDESMQFARNNSELDRDFLDNRQWSESEVSELERRGQSPTVYNRIKPVVEFYQGLEQATRSLPKALPVTPNEFEGASAATDSLQFVARNTKFKYTRSKAFKDMLAEGTCGIEIVWNPQLERIELQRYPWDRLWWDPHSREVDFSDARFKGVMLWMDYDEAVSKWPERRDVLEYTFMDLSEYTQSFEDTPRRWHDRKRKRCRVVRIYYHNKGHWWWATFAKGGYLDDPQPSPYVDEFGIRACTLEMQSAYCDREGHRYGKIRELISPQMDINKRLSKSLQLLSTRQTIAEKGAVDDPEKTRIDLTRPDAYIEINPDKKFDPVDSPQLAEGHVHLMHLAVDMINTAAPSASTIPRTSPYASGKAIRANQQASAVETSPLLDGLFAFEYRVYQCVWNVIRQFWRGEKWIRVTDDPDNIKFTALNRPQVVQDPVSGEVRFIVQNQLARMNVDIILDQVPSDLVAQAEQFELLADLYRVNPQAIPFDVLVEMSQLNNDVKQSILRRLRGQTPEAQAQARQQQAIQNELIQQQFQQADAEIAKTAAEADKATEQANKFEAETLEILRGDAAQRA